MMVMAVFAIGFAASGDSEDEEVFYDSNGKKFRKVYYTCANCGETPEWAWEWKSTVDSETIDPHSHRGVGGLKGNFYAGKFYCSKCITETAKKMGLY